MSKRLKLVLSACCIQLLSSHAALADESTLPPPPATSSSSATSVSSADLSDAQLSQLLAPIALYPDALLAQVLMASTYPIDIVTAARWQKNNSQLKGTALQDALAKQQWQPSVKSLVPLPQVLQMMNTQLEWTQELGVAFKNQQSDVMATVQTLRAQAQQAGNLKSSSEQTVAASNSGNITIVPTSQTVYVPAYNTNYVYGAWGYPGYAPYAFYPAGYSAAGAVFGFTAGVAVGAAMWGACDWNHGNVSINTANFNSFNRTNISSSNWSHNANYNNFSSHNNWSSNINRANGSFDHNGNFSNFSNNARGFSGANHFSADNAFHGSDNALASRNFSNRGMSSFSGGNFDHHFSGGGFGGGRFGGGGFGGRMGGGRR